MSGLLLARRSLLAPTAVAFTPTSLPSLHSWYDAGAIAALVDGDPVASWTDSSGNSRTMAQATSAARPTYKTNILNSRPVVRFDGVDDLLTATGTAFGTTTLTTYAVVKRRNIGVNYDRLVSCRLPPGNDFANGDAALLVAGKAGGAFVGYRAAGEKSATTAVASDVASVVASRFDGTNHTMYLNGTAGTPVASSGTFIATEVSLGAAGTAASFSNCDLAEVLIYAASHDATQRGQVHAYLGARYGITVV